MFEINVVTCDNCPGSSDTAMAMDIESGMGGHAIDVQVFGIILLPIQHLMGHHSSESGTISFAHRLVKTKHIPESHMIRSNPQKS